jgi:hypothetical protein
VTKAARLNRSRDLVVRQSAREHAPDQRTGDDDKHRDNSVPREACAPELANQSETEENLEDCKAADRLGCILDSGGDVRAHDHRRTREEERE